MGKPLLKKPFFLLGEPGRSVKDRGGGQEKGLIKAWIENLNERKNTSGTEMAENHQQWPLPIQKEAVKYSSQFCL